MSSNHTNAQSSSLLRASRLAELAGVSLPTIKHYVNEGLLPKPLKTGRTMAYYDPSCVERIKLIKKLQKDQFLPLDVIKRVLDSGPAYDEELQMGQALLKSYKTSSRAKPIPEHQIERRAGYSLRKIRLLEKHGLIMPEGGENGRYYDAIDCKVIEIMKRREAVGVPFDHSVETLRLYREALERAVTEDIRLFARDMLGGFSTSQTLTFLTEVDDSLDSFVVLIRQKLLRMLASEGVRQVNNLPKDLSLLLFLPIAKNYLPSAPPDQPPWRIFYLLCAGAYEAAAKEAGSAKKGPSHAAAEIIAYLLAGDTETALALADKQISPAEGGFADAAGALAYLFSLETASGFSGPINLVKKSLTHLHRIELAPRRNRAFSLLADYICGSVYVCLPDMFDKRERGLRLLEHVEKSLSKVKIKGAPEWVRQTFQHEILPAAEVRVHRFLAEGNLRAGKEQRARRHLNCIIERTDANDLNSQWARLKRLEVTE